MSKNHKNTSNYKNIKIKFKSISFERKLSVIAYYIKHEKL